MNWMHWRRLLLAFFPIFIGTIAVGPPAFAGSFKVNPITLAIPPDRTTTSSSLTNNGTEPVSVRVLTYRWTQKDGTDVHQETTDLVVSPPIFTLAPGSTQLVRIGVTDRRAGGAYRVVFEEIAPQRPAGTMVQVALRLDLPLHVEAANGAPDLAWKAWRDDSGAIAVEAVNSGTRHQRVLAIGHRRENGAENLLTQEMGVVLPASSRRWLLGSGPRFQAGSALTLLVRTPEGEEQQSVVVQQR